MNDKIDEHYLQGFIERGTTFSVRIGRIRNHKVLYQIRPAIVITSTRNSYDIIFELSERCKIGCLTESKGYPSLYIEDRSDIHKFINFVKRNMVDESFESKIHTIEVLMNDIETYNKTNRFECLLRAINDRKLLENRKYSYAIDDLSLIVYYCLNNDLNEIYEKLSIKAKNILAEYISLNDLMTIKTNNSYFPKFIVPLIDRGVCLKCRHGYNIHYEDKSTKRYYCEKCNTVHYVNLNNN